MTSLVTVDNATGFTNPRKYDIEFWFLVGVHVIVFFCERCGGDEFFYQIFSLLVQVTQVSGQGIIYVLGYMCCR